MGIRFLVLATVLGLGLGTGAAPAVSHGMDAGVVTAGTMTFGDPLPLPLGHSTTFAMDLELLGTVGGSSNLYVDGILSGVTSLGPTACGAARGNATAASFDWYGRHLVLRVTLSTGETLIAELDAFCVTPSTVSLSGMYQQV